SKGTNPLEGRVVYHEYDNKGNPIEVSKKDGTHIVYIWGYNKTQPIAKIENATYSQVQSQVANLQTRSNNDNDRTQGTFGNEGQLRNALTALRNSLPNSQVTTFTYDPLIGVTSITDPRGQTIYYHYDSFNRLEFVKDNEGNILSKNEYNYKN
uniref:RHS repeat domain-containing protein n=1 Tax=Polaribacter sp. TaxID=1920175 RepID=UPI003F6BF285